MTTSFYVSSLKKSRLDLYALTTDQRGEIPALPGVTEILMRDRDKEEADWAKAANEVHYIRQDNVNNDVFWLKAQSYVFWTLYKPNGNILRKANSCDMYLSQYREISAFAVIS